MSATRLALNRVSRATIAFSQLQPFHLETDHDQSQRDVPQHPWGAVQP